MVIEIKIKNEGKVYSASVVFPDPDFEPIFYLSEMTKCLSFVRGLPVYRDERDLGLGLVPDCVVNINPSASAVGTCGNEQGEDK